MHIFRIRIVLDIEEDVFRDIEIESTANLEDLHNGIYNAFGIEGQEMASFYRSDQEWTQGEEIPLFGMNDEPVMADILIEDILSTQDNRLLYVYDYMAMWTFFVELMDVVTPELGNGNYPYLMYSQGIFPNDMEKTSLNDDLFENIETPLKNDIEDEFEDDDLDESDFEPYDEDKLY